VSWFTSTPVSCPSCELSALARGDHEVLLVSAGEGDDGIELLVRPRDAGPDAEATIYGADRARYLALERARDQLREQWPGLFLMPYVSYRRLAREPALAAGEEAR
jgi:hypothetical protein